MLVYIWIFSLFECRNLFKGTLISFCGDLEDEFLDFLITFPLKVVSSKNVVFVTVSYPKIVLFFNITYLVSSKLINNCPIYFWNGVCYTYTSIILYYLLCICLDNIYFCKRWKIQNKWATHSANDDEQMLVLIVENYKDVTDSKKSP